jgi:hypothetical protein
MMMEEWKDTDWIRLAWNREECLQRLNKVMNF